MTSPLPVHQWARISELFERALDVDPASRAAWLHAQCGTDETLRDAVERLLSADREADDFLQTPIAGALLGDDDVEGRVFGAWRATRLIGSGGMGEVWLAERVDGDFEQQVALKRLLYPTPELRRRFGQERRVLARLRHPHIAQLFDGGVDVDGVPYFIMEYVEGAPITAYCDQADIGFDARLALFLQICDAVQYAHRNLVVHRDLKPGNVLVNAEGAVKLLDFGIAKVIEATDEGGATQTLVQRLTPDYAAPEQIRGEVVTTATDVYALGVLLFELLTGTRPFHSGAQRVDLRAAILDAAPAVPSATAARSAGRPSTWAKRLLGDLDRIILRALAKEPERRYATAAALADDLQRYRSGRPVMARGDSPWYRTRKFVRRNRAGVAAAAIAVFALVGASVVSLVQAHRATLQSDLYRAEAGRNQAVLEYVAQMFRDSGRATDATPATARGLLDNGVAALDEHFSGRPEDLAHTVYFLARLYSELYDDVAAAPLEKHFLDSSAASADADTTARIRMQYALAELRGGNTDSASTELAAVQAFWARDSGKYRDQIARGRIVEAQIAKQKGDVDGAIAILRALLPEAVDVFGADNIDTVNVKNSLGLALMQTGELDEADRWMGEVVASWKAKGDATDGLLTAEQNLGAVAFNRGEFPRAEALLRQSIDRRRTLFGPSAAMAAAELNLARTLIRSGQPDAALPVLDEAVPIALQFTGDHSPVTVGLMQAQAEQLLARGDAGDASPIADRAAVLARDKLGERSPVYAFGELLQARVAMEQGDRSKAEPLYEDAVAKLAAAGSAGRVNLAYAAQHERELH